MSQKQEKDLRLSYTEQELATIKEYCKKHGLWRKDPIFPDDPSKIWWMVYDGGELEDCNKAVIVCLLCISGLCMSLPRCVYAGPD